MLHQHATGWWRRRASAFALVMALGLAVACADDDGGAANRADVADVVSSVDADAATAETGDSGGMINGVALPAAESVTFVEGVTNPYFPLPVGGRWVFEAATPDGLERVVVEVLAETRSIEGVTATVVYDVETLDGVLVEETHDWFAQDSSGAVWYLGEDTCELEEGVCVNHKGAWEWGQDGALPGIIMPAVPAVDGQPYYQEYYPGEAEDVGEVVAVGQSVTVPAGTWSDCVKTHDTSTLDLGMDEHKYYCRDVGPVLTEEWDERAELVQVTGPGLGATAAEAATWIAEFKAAHPGRAGDVLAMTPEQLAADPDAARLRGLCGEGRLPVIPLLAWEYGGSDHAWMQPEASALVYCVYAPVVPGTPHWSHDAEIDKVTADVYVLFPAQNPCEDAEGARTVADCIGHSSNFEILVDTASYHDGHDVGLELSESATTLNLLLANGVRVHLTTEN